MVLGGFKCSYIWPARTWTWSTAQPWILVKLSHDHTCVSSDLHIHEFGLLHNGVHTWDYLLERWRCLFIGTRMELSISFIDLIHAYEGLSANALNDCMWAEAFKGWQVMLRTLDTLMMCSHIFAHKVLSKQVTQTRELYSFLACHGTPAQLFAVKPCSARYRCY